MPHSVFALTLIDEVVGEVRDVLVRLTACAQFESAEKIARCRTHDLLHLPDGLFDSIDVILQDEAVMGTGDDRQVAGTRGYQAQ